MNLRNIIIPLLLISLCWVLPMTAEAQNNSWEVPEEAKKVENPLDSSKEIIAAGKNIFSQLCAVCHGGTGKGDGVTAASLNPKPANLAADTVQKQTDGTIYWKIKEGRPPMPSFKTQLNDKQAWALVTYIRSLDKDTSN